MRTSLEEANKLLSLLMLNEVTGPLCPEKVILLDNLTLGVCRVWAAMCIRSNAGIDVYIANEEDSDAK